MQAGLIYYTLATIVGIITYFIVDNDDKKETSSAK